MNVCIKSAMNPAMLMVMSLILVTMATPAPAAAGKAMSVKSPTCPASRLPSAIGVGIRYAAPIIVMIRKSCANVGW